MENLKENGHFEHQGAVESVLLKWLLNKQYFMTWSTRENQMKILEVCIIKRVNI